MTEFMNEIEKILFEEEFTHYLNKAKEYCALDKEAEVRITHFVVSLMNDNYDNIITTTLTEMKVDLHIFSESLEDFRKSKTQSKKIKSNEVVLSESFMKLLLDSNKLKTDVNPFSIKDFFIGILSFENELTQLLLDNVIDKKIFVETLASTEEFYNEINDQFNDDLGDVIIMPTMKGISLSSKTNENKTSEDKKIFEFVVNLNEEYLNGKINDCVGREKEILKMEIILNRRQKRNPLLIGKAGVGKTALVEGLVANICNNKCSFPLKNKIVLSLNLTDLVSGTVWRGQLEEKIKSLLDFLKKSDKYILFIDEIHNIVDVGGSGGAGNLTNILKPYLSRGLIQVIGATTQEEQKEFLEKDRAISRRFNPILVNESSEEETVIILNKIKNNYEKSHGVSYSDEVIHAIVKISSKIKPNLAFPDKAIELMDDVGSLFKTNKKNENDFSEELESLRLQKKKLFEEKKYEDAIKILALDEQIKKVLKKENINQKNVEISVSDVYSIVKSLYNIEYKDFTNLSEIFTVKNEILNHLKEQDNIVEDVFEVILSKYLFNNIDEDVKPLSFLFVGSTGVGKTYFGKLLAKYFYNDKIKILNCELFKEKHAISNLIGSPKGYVDSQSGSQLFEFVKHNPQSLILLDEVEKAHPDFFDTLLTILDDGKIEDKDGLTIDFTNCMFILTSNVGTKKVADFKQIGFNNFIDSQEMLLDKEVRKSFKPEFINRIDKICYFNLINNNISNIIDVEVEKYRKILKLKGINFELDSEDKESLLEVGVGGVREISRKIKDIIIKKVKKQMVTMYTS